MTTWTFYIMNTCKDMPFYTKNSRRVKGHNDCKNILVHLISHSQMFLKEKESGQQTYLFDHMYLTQNASQALILLYMHS